MNENNGWKKAFFTITAGQTISLIGSSAVQFALIWWLASKTASPMVMAVSGLAAFLPQMVLGPFAGVWIDRLKRKYVVIGADLFIGLAALVFAAAFLKGEPPYWTVFLVLGVRAVGSVFHTPAIQAVVPLLVPKEELVRANGFSQFLQSGAFMLGPVLGALMYGALPMEFLLLTDFLGAVAASVTVAVIKIPEAGGTGGKAPDFREEFREGVTEFRKDKRLAALIICSTACMVFFLPLSSMYPLMTSSYFQAGAIYGSLVELTYAFGMMGSALLIGAFGKIRRKLLAAYGGLLGLGVTSAVCGLLPPKMWAFWIFAVTCMAMGGCGNIYGIPVMAYMQEKISKEAQGRVFSLIGSLSSCAMPVGLLLSGPVAERYGVVRFFLLSGILILFFTGIGMWYELRQETEKL